MEYILGFIAVLLGGIGYLFVKNKSATALLDNTETKEKVLDMDREINKYGAANEIEELRRELEKKNAEELKKLPLTPKDFN